MSKIGNQPIFIPTGVEVKNEASTLTVKGPKGELSLVLRPEIKAHLNQEKKEIRVTRTNEAKLAKSLHGLSRTLIANMLIGVTEGFQKKLKVMGTGYRAALEGKELVLSVGFSHPLRVQPKEGVEFAVKGSNEIIIKGIDKQLVGEVAAQVRQLKPPDVYKGKGIRYFNELVRKKAGKAVKTGVPTP